MFLFSVLKLGDFHLYKYSGSSLTFLLLETEMSILKRFPKIKWWHMDVIYKRLLTTFDYLLKNTRHKLCHFKRSAEALESFVTNDVS